MVMVFCPCGWNGSGFELAALSIGAVQERDNPNHLIIYVDEKQPEHDDKMQCPNCGLDFEKMAEWMNKNIPV